MTDNTVTVTLRWPDDMTLGDAVELLTGPSFACACIGPFPGHLDCPCQETIAQAEALHRAAHIVARQLADATRRPFAVSWWQRNDRRDPDPMTDQPEHHVSYAGVPLGPAAVVDGILHVLITTDRVADPGGECITCARAAAQINRLQDALDQAQAQLTRLTNMPRTHTEAQLMRLQNIALAAQRLLTDIDVQDVEIVGNSTSWLRDALSIITTP